MPRNGWQLSAGTVGRFTPESLAGYGRNTQYSYKQAAIKNRIAIPVSEYSNIPDSQKPVESEKKWEKIYKSIISDISSVEFSYILGENYDESDKLSERIINIFPSLSLSNSIFEKLIILIEKLIECEKEKLTNSISAKLKGALWHKYANEIIIDKLSSNITINADDSEIIKKNTLEYLRDNYGDWDEENKVSIILNFIYQGLSEKSKNDLARAYAIIYCDHSRKDRFPQKRLANKIFKELKRNRADIFEIIKPELLNYMQNMKIEDFIFNDVPDDEKKDYIIRHTKVKYGLLLNDIQIDVDNALDELYDQ